MARDDWAHTTIPKEFQGIVRDIVDNRRYGYSSVPEVLRDAMRRLLLDLGALHWDKPEQDDRSKDTERKKLEHE